MPRSGWSPIAWGAVWLALSPALGLSTAAAGQRLERLQSLRCEGIASPLAVAEARPVLSWIYGGSAGAAEGRENSAAGEVQVAARVMVARSEQAANAGRGDVWDSGWVRTEEMHLRYGGAPLAAGTRYWWRVETRNRDGSRARGAATSFRSADPHWTAQWIAAPWSTERDGAEQDGSRPMPIFRRAFRLRARPVEATLRLAGLGQWQASLGHAGGSKPVAPPGLHGAWTDYRKTVTYDSVDVTPMLRTGRNVLAVMLGNGMYNVQRTPLPQVARGSRYTKFVGSFGVPKLIAELQVRYADGHSETIGTDTRWRAERGPLVFDSTYGGEDFDARREQRGWDLPGFDDRAWSAAQVVDGPGGVLIPAIAPQVGLHRVHTPLKQTDVGGGRTVYDLGQNFAGIVSVRVKGPAGAVLRLTPGELLNSDGTVSQATFHGPMWWDYILRGDPKGEQWQPLFDYGGFRYVQAEWTPAPGMTEVSATPPPGQLLSLAGIAEHSDAEETGSFASSSEMLNRIHALIVAAMHNNEVSLLTDCPEREKLGWLEQTHLQAPGLMYNNDLQRIYRAQDRNMADAQKADGIVPTIAPQYTKFGPKYPIYDDSPEWGSAMVLEPWWAYSVYGDKAELERDYPGMQRYVSALEGQAVDGIVAYGLGDWYDIGPGAPGFEQNTSLGVTATLTLYQDAMAMQQIATLLGHADEAKTYAALGQRTAAAFQRRFWDAAHGWYDRGSQTANAMPLALGVVPAELRAQVLAHVVEDIHAHHDHVTTGEVGYPYLLRALEQGGRDDVVLAMMLRRDPPSYGAQLMAGATALTEAWDANPHSSQDHFMLGSAEEWFYRSLGGIDIDEWRSESAERLTVRPIAFAGVDWVRCGFISPEGRIESDWRREGAEVLYTVTVPLGVEATVALPLGSVAEINKATAIAGSAEETRFRVGPGAWSFRGPGSK